MIIKNQYLLLFIREILDRLYIIKVFLSLILRMHIIVFKLKWEMNGRQYLKYNIIILNI